MNDSTDTDLAILIVTAPLWLFGFLALAAAGWVTDLLEAKRV